MLLQDYIYIKWNSKTKNKYVELGYIFTKIGDSFLIKVSDLMPCSQYKVKLSCDYCGKEFEQTWFKRYKFVNLGNIKKDCCSCNECIQKKAKESLKLTYGVENPMQITGSVEEAKLSYIKKYGVDNPSKSPEIKEKIKNTCIEKYGFNCSSKNEKVIKKTKETCIKKYGVECYLNLDYSGDKIRGENSPRWKSDKEYCRQERATFEYINWRKLVFEKNHFTCVKCGKTNCYLNAHHIKNWKDNEDSRYDVDNGITLCRECHIEFHKIYGKKNNNIQQLNEFLDKNIC